MTAFNVVRLRVTPGRETQFGDEHRNAKANFPGFRRSLLVKTGECADYFIGEYKEFASVADGEERMVRILDRFRNTRRPRGWIRGDRSGVRQGHR
jgi:hypothetical protein